MTRFPYDQFAKDYLKELLLSLGEVTPSRKVAGEIREIDVYFAPSLQPQIDKQALGLLGQFTTTQALFEPFRNAVQRSEVRSCMSKLFDVYAQLEREARSNNTNIEEESLPRLWILSPTASELFLDGFRTLPDEENWPAGIHFLGDSLRTAVVAIHQLPRTPETLWVRLLGKGRVQQQAVAEVEALPKNHPLRDKAIELLLSLKTTLEVSQNIDVEDRDLIMQLSPIYTQRLAEATQQGVQQGVQQGIQQGIQQGVQQGVQTERRTTIENLLRVRFGALDNELQAIVESLLALPPEEYTPLLLQLSREDLLARFSQK